MRRVRCTIIFLMFMIMITIFCTSSAEELIEEIQLSESNVFVYVGGNIQIKVENGSSEMRKIRVIWESTDPDIATVNNGKIYGKKAGECDVICYASDELSVKSICHVEVRLPIQNLRINETNITLLVGTDEKLSKSQLTYTIAPENAYNMNLRWISSDESVVSVDANGVIKAHHVGSATVALVNDDPNNQRKAQVNVKVLQAITSILIPEDSLIIPEGKTEAIKLKIEPSNASNKQVSWKSSDETVAIVSGNGQVRALSSGSVIIEAKAQDGSGVTSSCKIEVITPVRNITVDDKRIQLAVGAEWVQTINIMPENASNKKINWTSSDDGIASVNEKGIIKGNGIGKCMIGGTSDDGSGTNINVSVEVDEYEVIIRSKEPVFVDFETESYTYDNRTKVGKIRYGNIFERKVTYKNKCVEPTGIYNNMLQPLKSGVDVITVTETRNKKKEKNEVHKVYVTQYALSTDSDPATESNLTKLADLDKSNINEYDELRGDWILKAVYIEDMAYTPESLRETLLRGNITLKINDLVYLEKTAKGSVYTHGFMGTLSGGELLIDDGNSMGGFLIMSSDGGLRIKTDLSKMFDLDKQDVVLYFQR